MLLHDYLEYHARTTPDNPFAEMGAIRLNYGEANKRANQLAHGLVALGLAKGDHFAYLSKNSIDMILIYYAASKVGIIPVPLNYRLAPPEWLHIISNAESRLLFAEEEFVAGINSIRDELDDETTYIGLGRESSEGWLDYDAWIGSQADDNPDVDIDASDQLYQMYTSGTTGLPKGAMLSQSSVDADVRMMSVLLNKSVDEERSLVVAPMYHAAAMIGLMVSISKGDCLVVHREFNPAEVIRSLSEDRITSALLVPVMIQACLVGVSDVEKRTYPQLHSLAYGASPIAEEVLRAAMRIFDCDFYQGFGMTETTAVASGLTAADHRLAVGEKPQLLLSAGRPLMGTRMKIVDENGNEVTHGTVGEILIKGPQVMMGYWNMPEATAQAIKDGWLHSGDAGKIDEDGYLYIQDRIKDMVVSGGENIYPREIENVLFEHSAIADVAVIGIPSEQWGESLLAFVVQKPGESTTADDVIEFCRQKLAGYKIPRQIEFIDELPRNASGKVLKKDLREPYWVGMERRIG